MPNPTIPGTTRDRTGSIPILRRAVKEIKQRYAGLQAEVLSIFGRIPVYQNNDTFGQVYYGLTPTQMQTLSDELQAAYQRWLVTKDPANIFWYSGHIDDAAQLGTAQSVANLTNLSASYAAARTLEQVIYSSPYQTRLAVAQLKSYEHWTGMAASQKAELSQIIGRAVIDGKNPKAVVTEIAERFEVSRSKALAYAQSDVTDTLRQARWAEAEYASTELNLNIGLLWTSALIKTTRATHAAKHGKVITTEDAKAFYSVNGNRYNCHCAQTECLLDKDNKPILTDRLKLAMLKEQKDWLNE